MAVILIIDDEALMRQGLADNLEFEGYTVLQAENGAHGLESALRGGVDLILLDVMMPALSGFDVCKQLRAAGIETPIILLTARGEEIDKVLGLELGADDYITKPFGIREVLARVKAILRRRTPTTSEIHIGRLAVDFQAWTAREEGIPVECTTREMDILRYLYEHRNAVVSREVLLTQVWGHDDAPTSRTVDNFMLRLRQKIEVDPSRPRHILTVHGIGYKLIH